MRKNRAAALIGEMVIFANVVECGSFSEAARQLGTTPSAVSRSIARLEGELKVRLLQRTTRKLRLSDVGAEIYHHCLAMIQAMQAAAAVPDTLDSEPAGKLRITAPRALARFLIHPHIEDFLAAHPKVDLVFRLEDRYVDLIEEQVDLAFRITDEPPPGLMGRRLMRIEHIICATPDYLLRHGLPRHPHDLKQHSCIALSEEVVDSRWRFSREGKSVSVDVKGRYMVNHAGIRLEAVLSGIGIGGVPYFIAKDALHNGQVVQVLPEWSFKTNYHGEAWILYPATRHLPSRMRAFIEFVAHRLQKDALLSEAVHWNS